MQTAAIDTRSDINDIGGKQLLRAKYIGEGSYRLHEWLVYGNDLDTCGAIVERKDGQYAAFQRGNFLGADRTIRRAIARCLSADDLATFIGTKAA